MANKGNSLTDPICPTYAAGAISQISGKGAASLIEFNNDGWNGQPGANYGYQNQAAGETVGSFNNDWQNGCHSQSVQPTYSSGLLSFGRTGRQS